MHALSGVWDGGPEHWRHRLLARSLGAGFQKQVELDPSKQHQPPGLFSFLDNVLLAFLLVCPGIFGRIYHELLEMSHLVEIFIDHQLYHFYENMQFLIN